MPKTLKVKKEEGEKARKLLSQIESLSQEYKITKDKKHLYIPIKKETKNKKLKKITKKLNNPKIVEKKELKTKTKTPQNLKEALENKLNKKELQKTPSSFDIIGDIAVIELNQELLNKKELIGKALMEVHKNLETVLLQKSPVTGEYRIKDLELIAGENKTKTIHKEHGCRFHVDLEKVFFSPRLSNEREKVTKQVKEKEIVFDMFAGVGPFSIIIAKKKKPKKVYAVDKNQKAIDLMKKNIELNNTKEVIKPLIGDIRKIAPNYRNSSDRVIMNLPFKSGSFLKEAFNLVKKKGGVIHYYGIRNEDDLFKGAIEKIKESAKKREYQTKVLDKRTVRSYSPNTWNIAIDVQLN